MLTQKEIKELLRYEPETGNFFWRVSNSPRRQVGSQAGCYGKDGYIVIGVNGTLYASHRLVWLYLEGYFPEYDIDHIDGTRDNNIRSNLRQSTKTCNAQNTKIYTTNTSGFPGVLWKKTLGKWVASIKVNGVSKHLGVYTDRLEAALARYTVEVNCPKWTCNNRSELAKAIKSAWPEFKFGDELGNT